MAQSQLPLWVQYAQALGAPSLVVVIAGVGAWIAYEQMRLARVKIQSDIYERKHAVFVAVHYLLTVVAGLKRAPYLEDMRDFIIQMNAVPFLFDDKLVGYLKEIERRVHRANGLQEMMQYFDDKETASKELQEHIAWLSEQTNVIMEKFRPSLWLRK